LTSVGFGPGLSEGLMVKPYLFRHPCFTWNTELPCVISAAPLAEHRLSPPCTRSELSGSLLLGGPY